MLQKVVMIGGMPRSGTTLIANYIQRELNIPILPETHFFSVAAARGGVIKIDSLPEPVLKDDLLGPAYSDIRGKPVGNRVESFEALLRAVSKEKYPVIGEKTPAHLMSFDEIGAQKNNYCFVIMVRSCAEVCNSLKNVPWNDGNNVKNALRWARYLREAARVLKKYPGRTVIINYKALCDNPKAELAKLKHCLGLSSQTLDASGVRNYDENLEPWKKSSRETPQKDKAQTMALAPLYRVFIECFDRFYRVYLRAMHRVVF